MIQPVVTETIVQETIVQQVAPELPRLGFDARVMELGLEITAVQPGSLAELLGLQPGDILSHVNDNPMESIPAYQAAIQQSVEEFDGFLKLQVNPLVAQANPDLEPTILLFADILRGEVIQPEAGPAPANGGQIGAGL